MKKSLIPPLSIIVLLTFPALLTGCSSNSSSQAPEPMTQPIITDGIQPEEQFNSTVSTAESIPLLPQESEAQIFAEAEASVSSTAVKEETQDTSASGHTSHTSGHSSYSSSTTAPNTAQPPSSSDPTPAATAPAPQNPVSGSAPAPTAAANPAQSPSIHDGEQVTDYYMIKAELDALDIDKDNLEAAYRIGRLDEASFRSQKNLLEAQEDQLDDAKDLAAGTRHSHGEHTTYEGTMEELIARLNTAKQRDDVLEQAIDQLEDDYRTGSIAREDFIARQAQLLFEEDIVDQEKDSLEHSLEQMGWDD